MATFETNPWITGEVITADKLNGGYNILEINVGESSFSIIIDKNLSAMDFIKMTIVQHNFGYDSYCTVYKIDVDEEEGLYTIHVNNWGELLYEPLTGILRSAGSPK